MGSSERRVHRAAGRAVRTIQSMGLELREARIAGGLSQEWVAVASGISRARLAVVEAGSARTLRFVEVARIGAVLGLDLAAGLHPAGGPLRDEAHARRLSLLLRHVAPPLYVRREVPLPTRDGPPDQRAWDAVIYGAGARTTVELEMRLRDAQAVERRLSLKRRDDPPDAFLLALADTTTNRRVILEHPGLFADLPRLRPSVVRQDMSAGRHPGSGLILL